MTFDTRASLRAWLVGQLPANAGGAAQATILNTAIADAVGYIGAWVRDTARDDFVGDGLSKRFLLTGADCQLADEAYQETPTQVATCTTLSAPTAAPTATVLPSGGTIPAGLYYAAVAYTATIGGVTCVTAPTAYTGPIVVPSGSSRITLAWTPPNTATDPTAGTQVYLSTGSGVADIRAAAATSGSTATATISSLPATSAARPLADYRPLYASYNPLRRIEQDTALDGTANVGTAVLTVTTAPALGDRFRVVYDRRPALPAQDTDTIRVEAGIMRQVALVFALEKLMANQEAGDTTALGALAQMADAKLTQIESFAAPCQARRPRVLDPRT